MEVDLISEAFKFMLLGMGNVFIFLIVMIFSIKIQAFIIAKYFAKKEVNTKSKNKTLDISNTSKKIAAISAAIEHHNNIKG